MSFNFPASPTIGQKYTPSTGITYIWTGSAWDRVSPKSAGAYVMPAGVVMAFAGTVLPQGALWCDGNTFDQALYPALYAALGNSNVTPDLRGRVIVGVDRDVGGFANRVTNAGVGNPGLDSRTMRATGGFDRYTIAQAQMPAHTHDGSGTTSTISADHAHNFNVNSGGENVGHQHFVSGYTAADGSHRHTYDRYTADAPVTQTVTTANQSRNNVTNNTGYDGGHQHSMNFWAGGINQGHVHNVAGGTSGVTSNHTHTYSFTSTSKGGGEAHPIIQPSMVLGYIIFTGEVA